MRDSQDNDIVENISAAGSVGISSREGATHEKMTFLGKRFLEKGRRSGSLLFHSFMLPRVRHSAQRQAYRRRGEGRVRFADTRTGGDGTRGWPGAHAHTLQQLARRVGAGAKGEQTGRSSVEVNKAHVGGRSPSALGRRMPASRGRCRRSQRG